MTSSGEIYRAIVVRVSPEDLVLYANRAAAAYLGVSKDDLVGAPLEALAARARGEVAECFARPLTGRAVNRLVTDAEGRVFELKTSSDGGVLDIVLDEVTTAESVGGELRGVTGIPLEVLDEEELRTARQPERRTLTVSASRMNGLATAAERLLPMETRLMVNSFLEEASEAVLASGCTVQLGGSGVVLGLFGAPRQFADHALRAVRAACDQNQRLANLRAAFLRQGKELLPVTCGIWTGEGVVGTIGNSEHLQYSAVGAAVEHASRLGRLARPGETLVSEFTIRSIVRTLPEGWQAVQAESETEPDLSDFLWHGEDIVPVPDELRRAVWLVGPGVEEDISRVEFYFDYLWALKVPDIDEPVPILRVVRPAEIGDSIEFRDDNVVATRFSQSLGKYKLIAIVGVGGMGKVWKAHDRYGNTVAIKVLHATETASETQLKRFRREAEVMARLAHRNICRVFEMNEFEEIHFLVMEYVDGLTLADLLQEPSSDTDRGSAALDIPALIRSIRLSRESRGSTDSDQAPGSDRPSRILPIEQALSIFVKICEAVQFAHEHGVLHRDLKPGNILLREDGEPLVADFGLAKMGNDAATDFSVTGNVVGTLENMAPEQAASSKSVDERADVYALGTILFQMLTGRRHFKTTGNIVADAQALQDHEAPRPRAINSDLDADLEIIIRKALRNSPTERYRSVEALRTDIERYRRGEPISARPVTALDLFRKLVQRNRVAAGSIAASLIVIFAATGIAVWRVAERAEAAENARLQAEAALLEAERQSDAAKRSERLAQEQKREAEQRRKEAADALEALRAAREAEREAQRLAKGAREETATERAARLRSEELARQAMLRVDELERQATAEAVPSPTPVPEPVETPEQIARRKFFELYDLYVNGFPSASLSVVGSDPVSVLRRMRDNIQKVSEAILDAPTFAALWILKAHMHVAIGELDAASKSLDRALNNGGADGRVEPRAGNAGALLAVVRDYAKPGADRSRLSPAIESGGTTLDDVTAGLVRFFTNRDVLRRMGSGISRESSPAEVALALLMENGGRGRYTLTGNALAVSGTERVNGLRVIAPGRFRRLAISDAWEIDWMGLSNQEFDDVDFSGSRLSALPQNPRLLPRTRRLSVEGNSLRDVVFARSLPGLEELDISDTWVTDLSPLAMLRQLRTLDAGGLRLENLSVLAHIPLENLTLSPELITDRQAVESLRGYRNLRILRSPADSEDQSREEFFRKWDAGEYPPATR